jgi:benzylsuccinate CoA-transferase BbsF subunit
MAIMGAEVIKVGSSKRPDPSYSGPAFHSYNQSKRYVSVNLASSEGIEIIKDLSAISDVVIENFATGVIERRGLGYEVLSSLNPSIIMISSSGVGHSGPKKNQVAYGSLLQHYTGWNSQSGNQGSEPVKGGLWADPWVGMELAMVTTACLNYRAASGLGQYVDFSMAEALVGSMPITLLNQQINGSSSQPIGNDDEFDLLSDLFSCKGEDRWLALSITSKEEWDTLCKLFDKCDLGSDGEVNESHKDEMIRIIRSWAREKTDLEAANYLQNNGIPAAPSWNIHDVYHDGFLKEDKYMTHMETNDGEDRYMPGVPWSFREGPDPIVGTAPKLGQDNPNIFRELLGIDKSTYVKLSESGVLE